jgi:hypothetical protein
MIKVLAVLRPDLPGFVKKSKQKKLKFEENQQFFFKFAFNHVINAIK